MLTLDDARLKVTDLCPQTLDPALTDNEIDAALTRTAIATTWTATTAYAFGQRIVPTAPMGRVYIVTHAGTTGATEPTWLIVPVYVAGRNPLGGWGFASVDPLSPSLFGLADGTVAWCDYGPFVGEIYDINAAAAEAWRTKARKCADRVDNSIQGAGRANESLTYERCMDQARALQPVRVV